MAQQPKENLLCTYLTEHIAVAGSAKGADGWFPIDHITVYFDHPFRTPIDHTLNLDFTNEKPGERARVAVELTPDGAKALLVAIGKVLTNDEVTALLG